MLHFPVLLEESIDFLIHDIDGHYLDCTYGRGGHSKLILEMISNNGFLSAFDKDPDSISFASNIKAPNFKIYNDSFKNLEQYMSFLNRICHDLLILVLICMMANE